jgi:hypothetical protein
MMATDWARLRARCSLPEQSNSPVLSATIVAFQSMAAMWDDGMVVGVPQERGHPYPFLWLNGSVASFIQIAGRWSLALPIFSLLEKAGEAEQLMDSLYRFPEYARSENPKIGLGDRFRCWNEIADNW